MTNNNKDVNNEKLERITEKELLKIYEEERKPIYLKIIRFRNNQLLRKRKWVWQIRVLLPNDDELTLLIPEKLLPKVKFYKDREGNFYIAVAKAKVDQWMQMDKQEIFDERLNVLSENDIPEED